MYSLKDKLKFEEKPRLEVVEGTVLTVNNDAETVLKLMDVVNTKGEMEGAIEAVNILFSAKDRKALGALKLSMGDYTTVIATAMSLAVGENPDDTSEE